VLGTLLARIRRDLGARLLRLAERLAPVTDEAAQGRREDLLRERFPDAPEHWIQLVAARSLGFVAHHPATPPPAQRAPVSPPPVPTSLPKTMPDRDGFGAGDLPRQAPPELPPSPARRRPIVTLAANQPVRPSPASSLDWSHAGTRTSAPAAVFARGEGCRRPVFTVIKAQPPVQPAPATPRWSGPRASRQAEPAPASFAMAASVRADRPTFVEAATRLDRRAQAAGPAWTRAERHPAPPPTWPAQFRSPADLDVPPVAPARRDPPAATFAEAAAECHWPELPKVPERHDPPPADQSVASYRERLLRLARDQERL
jgi:hypothetical protein